VLAGEAAAEAARKQEQAPEPEFPVVGDTRAAAFFDLDNTVMQGAALFHFGRGLHKRKFFRTRDLARFAWQQAFFRLAGAENAGHMQDARDSALSIVRGRRVSELTDRRLAAEGFPRPPSPVSRCISGRSPRCPSARCPRCPRRNWRTPPV
jgi:hypothetical protein